MILNLFTDALTEEQMAELLYYLLFTLPSDCSMKTFAEQLMYFAKLDREADAMSESQLLTVHLALVRAGLIKLDLSLLPEFNMIRIIAECMAACVPQSLLDYIGITRDELAELYYQQLTVYWIQLNDPDIRNALEDMWRYVIYGEPLDIEIN